MEGHPKQPGFVKGTERPNTVGLEARQLDVLLNHLDAPPEQTQQFNRTFARWPFRRTAVRVTIFHPGGSLVVLKLACRNLSRGGVGLLHNSYIHPGSRCVVELPNQAGKVDRVDGVVCRCIHRRGTLHEIGVRFNREVDVARYVRREADYTPAIESVNPEQLTGSVLCVDPLDADVEQIRGSLRDTRMSLRHVHTGAEALAEDPRAFTVYIIERSLPDMFGLDVLRSFREAGVNTPVLMLSRQGWGPGEVSDKCAAWAQKPVEPGLLLRILAELQALGGSNQSEPRRSVV
jgi:CheY-like chemotaxis protein